MFRKPTRPSHGTVVAYLALFVALGGTSYAAVTLSKNDVRSKHIKDGQVKKRDIGRNAITSAKVQDGELRARDFKLGELVAGAPGPQGPTGPQGLKGDTGTVDTANFYDRTQSDARFLAAAGKAADADLLDGLNATDFLGAAAKAADADKLDGLDSERFARFAGRVASNGTVSQGSGFTVSKPVTGTYDVAFPVGTFSGCRHPVVSATPLSSSARFLWVSLLSCGLAGDASFTVKTAGSDGTTATDTAFMFVAA